jgi:hypothetical protein
MKTLTNATVRTRERVTHAVVIETDDEEFELETTFAPEQETLLIERLPNGGTVVGYLVQDTDCANPLDDCDGMGKILDRRHARSDVERECLEAMGIDEYGEPAGKPNPYAVVLDVYSHGMDVWRVHGRGPGFPDEQWEVSNGAGVWIADEPSSGGCRRARRSSTRPTATRTARPG